MDSINEVPFDMTKETLKSIRDWINKITQVSLGFVGASKIPMNEMITVKRDMVRQLIVLASPMMEENLEEIEDFFNDIKLKRGDIQTKDGWARNVIVYSLDVDSQLDECVKGVQKALKKYFIPKLKHGEKY